jgi:membrane fusion protein (multidrug efflux system)
MPDGQQNATLFAGPVKTPWRKTRGGRMLIAGIGLIILAAIGLWLFNWWTTGRFLESTNDAYLRADAVVISPKISGYVKQVLVGDNEDVPAGKPLLLIDSAPYQAAQDMAEAEVAQRRADLVRFKADAAKQEAARAEAVARVTVAEAAARFAAQDAARFQRLAKAGADTTQRRDQALSTRDQTAGEATAAPRSIPRRANSTRCGRRSARARPRCWRPRPGRMRRGATSTGSRFYPRSQARSATGRSGWDSSFSRASG